MHSSKSNIKNYRGPHTRSSVNSAESPSPYGNIYPGLDNSSSLIPSQNQGSPLSVPVDSGSLMNPGNNIVNAFKGLPIDQVKNIVNRMGGIQGIVESMGKMQTLFASFQQMAPMLKLLFSSFGSKKASATNLNAKMNRPSYKRQTYRKKRKRSPMKLPSSSSRH